MLQCVPKEVSEQLARVRDSVFLVLKLKKVLDTLIQKLFFLIIKINNFWGDRTDISAKQALVKLPVL